MVVDSHQKERDCRVSSQHMLTGGKSLYHARKNNIKCKRNISCVMFNVQSIRSKFDDFRCYIAAEKPDIVCVTNTRVSKTCGDRLEEFELQGYDMFSYCRETKQGGRVFMYVNSL